MLADAVSASSEKNSTVSPLVSLTARCNTLKRVPLRSALRDRFANDVAPASIATTRAAS